jgi:hypothetical protein
VIGWDWWRGDCWVGCLLLLCWEKLDPVGGVGRRGGNSRQAGLKFSFKEIVVFDEKLFRSKYIVVHCGIGMFFLLSEGGFYPGMIKDGRFGRVL